jgi:hypothetical protein
MKARPKRMCWPSQKGRLARRSWIMLVAAQARPRSEIWAGARLLIWRVVVDMEEALEVRSGRLIRSLDDDQPRRASAIRTGGRRFHELSRHSQSLSRFVASACELVHTLAGAAELRIRGC